MNGYLEPAGLARILRDGAGLSMARQFAEMMTADAVAKNRTNIIQFPLINRRATNDTPDITKPAA